MIERFSAGSQPWMVEVHFPERPRGWPLKKYLERYDPREMPVASNFHDTFEGKPGLQKRDAETYGEMSEDDYKEGLAHYYASFEQLDVQVGRLLDAVDERGQADNTLVIFAADHGAPYGAHHMWIPNFAPYEELCRIPMAMRWPGRIEPGGRPDRLVQLHDIGHTLVDLLDLPLLPHPHGASLAPLFENPRRDDWRDMIFAPWYGQDFLMIQRMAITERFKYVFNAFDFDECYNLAEAPSEFTNVVDSPRHAEVVDDMRARLYELMEEFEDPYGDRGTAVRFMAPRYLPRGRRL